MEASGAWWSRSIKRLANNARKLPKCAGPNAAAPEREARTPDGAAQPGPTLTNANVILPKQPDAAIVPGVTPGMPSAQAYPAAGAETNWPAWRMCPNADNWPDLPGPARNERPNARPGLAAAN